MTKTKESSEIAAELYVSLREKITKSLEKNLTEKLKENVSVFFLIDDFCCPEKTEEHDQSRVSVGFIVLVRLTKGSDGYLQPIELMNYLYTIQSNVLFEILHEDGSVQQVLTNHTAINPRLETVVTEKIKIGSSNRSLQTCTEFSISFSD